MNLHVLSGPNFSGRTARLREWVGLPDNPAVEPIYNHSAYIGPDAASSLSGIAPTVGAEIELMASDKNAAEAAKRIMESLGFGYCLERNPFTLSGGEQIVTAIIAATSSRPHRLAIDSAFEQLSSETRSNILKHLESLDGELMVADNRLDEWHGGITEEFCATPDAPTIKPEIKLDSNFNSSRIELIDLSHSYTKGRPVLKNVNLTLEAGAQYLLRGPNGCGKTTLSKILCGLIKPTSGEIRVDGKVVQPWLTPGRFVSYHFQNPDYQLFANSVRAQFESPTAAIFAYYFGLEKLLDSHPLDLPYTLKKRVAVASTLAQKAGAVILDEPSIGQDNGFVSGLLNGNYFATSITISHSKKFESLLKIFLP